MRSIASIADGFRRGYRLGRLTWLVLAILSFPAALFGEESASIGVGDFLSGHLKYQPSLEIHDSDSFRAKNGPDTTATQLVDQRTAFNPPVVETSGVSLQFSAELETLALTSSTGAEQRRLAALLGRDDSLLPTDTRRLVRLRTELLDEDDAEFVTGFDRLLLRATLGDSQLSLGRQAVSWGNGLSFSVLDVFNPFSPIEIDRDYKPGDDMALLQSLLPDQRELQVLVVGRRDEEEEIRSESSSFAARLYSPIAPLSADVQLLAAAHFGEEFFGLGFSRSVFEGVLRADASYTGTEAGGSATSFLLNYDRTWVVFTKNVYGFAEYFHSGVGVERQYYSEPSVELAKRLDRGELYVLGKEYLSAGVRVEWTPLLQVLVASVNNLHDESGVVQVRGDYDLFQDFLLTVGVDLPFGGSGSEFGGVVLGQLPEVDSIEGFLGAGSLGPSVRGYLRLAYFF